MRLLSDSLVDIYIIVAGRVMKKILIFLFIILASIGTAFATIQDNIDNGIAWLRSSQNADGSFGNNSELVFRDTSEALTTLGLLNRGSIEYQTGLQWISASKANNLDYISRKIFLLGNEGIDASVGVNILIENQQLNGGWGIASYESDILDTVIALQALKGVNNSNQTVIEAALEFLLNSQNPDGGWGFYPATCSGCNDTDNSNLYITSLISSILQQFTQSTPVASAINNATNYITSKQQPNGGWATIFETSAAYMALIGVTTDNFLLGNAITHLLSLQSPDGSWLQDPFSTALALSALYYSEYKPEPPLSPTTGTLRGRVIDAATNQPLQGVSERSRDTSHFIDLTASPVCQYLPRQ